MDLALILILYVVGMGLIVAETMMPGLVIGIVGATLVTASVILGFRLHWGVGAAQIAVAVVVAPLAFYVGLQKLSMKAELSGSSFGQDHSALLGREGMAVTDLRPAGIVLIEGHKVDVVTAGDLIARGRRVRVSQVEGNRVIVRAI